LLLTNMSFFQTDIHSLAAEVHFSAVVARRAQPTPIDFEKALVTFNLLPKDLRPHRRNPVKKSKRTPAYYDPKVDSDVFGRPLPCIAPELSGKPDKDAKSFIPKSFPDFPSIHTYKYTPIDAAQVTVKGTGMRYEDGTPIGGTKHSPDDGLREIRGNPQKTREAAAKQAKQAEEALLGLVRASKKNDLNEAQAAAERNPLSKQRYNTWEATMRDLLEDPDMVNGGAQGGGEQARVAIAEQCMMVNAEKQYHRKEIQRLAKARTTKAA
jgi:transcription initiation factor TFIID subunit 8